MKNLLTILTIILTSIPCFSQITKSVWLIGGSASFSSFKYPVQGSPTQINIGISPNIGYFLIDKLAVGASASFTSDYFSDYPGKTNFFTVGPFARYYFLDTESVFNLFAQTGYEIQFQNKGNDPVSIYSISAGPNIFLNQNVALEFGFGYTYTPFNKINVGIKTFLTIIGLQIHLNK